MSHIFINPLAYCKIILHVAKYPYCAVNGVLLAKSSNAKGKVVEFVDAVPLFHLGLNLTPMAEIALTQIDQVASQAGLFIAGYYTAHENLGENSLEKANHRISDKIAENFGSACIVVVDNTDLIPTVDNKAIKVAQFNDGKYRELDDDDVEICPDFNMKVCGHLLMSKAYMSLYDFDNHLDDINKDWMNTSLNEQIKTLVQA